MGNDSRNGTSQLSVEIGDTLENVEMTHGVIILLEYVPRSSKCQKI